MTPSHTTIGIVITYQPEMDTLKTLIHKLGEQVDKIVLIDNGSDQPLEAWCAQHNEGKLIFKPQHENTGIAHALNVGIDYAIKQNADYVVLFDQDSLPIPQMVSDMISIAEDKESKGINVAAVGPRYLDKRMGDKSTFIRFDGFKRIRCVPKNNEASVDVDYVITSGCLLPLAAIKAVGKMRDDLFIDYVDIEWGLRAAHSGYKSFGAYNIVMPHNLGEAPDSFLGLKVSMHNHLRHYYLARNRTWLYTRSWVPLNVKVVDAFMFALRYAYHSIFTAPRWAHFTSMTKGIWHGLIGKMGRLDG